MALTSGAVRVPIFLLFLSLLALPGRAQERELEASGLPRDLVDRLVRIATDPTTERFEGDVVILQERTVPRSAVVLGTVRLEGVVQGDLIVIGGDAELRPGSEVWGDLTVVEGEIRGDEVARIGGFASQFSRALGTGIRTLEEADGVSVPLARDPQTGAASHFAFRVGDFNRVEGLQLLAGPVLTTGGVNPLRSSALLVWRSEGGEGPSSPGRLGYRVEAEQFFGGGREWRLGGGVHSTVSPIESQGLSDVENAWSTVLFTSDHRDHLERSGWTGFLRWTPRGLPLDVGLAFERETHGSVSAADPWSALGSGRKWRLQPAVGEGEIRSVLARVRVDTRDDLREPSDGWFVEGSVRQALGGGLELASSQSLGTIPAFEGGGPSVLPSLDAEFTTGSLDLRRYTTVGPRTRFNVRGVVGGRLDRDGILPPQYQHTLGGVGSLPGHPRFAADCGARGPQSVLPPEEGAATFTPFYGCDRFALFQTELRGGMGLRTGFGRPEVREAGSSGKARGHPRWVFFFNAGRAWAGGDRGGGVQIDPPALYDAGLGLLLGGVGVYWATPLGEGGEGSRWHVRLERRF